jgi:SAM-dependent methyltransferase
MRRKTNNPKNPRRHLGVHRNSLRVNSRLFSQKLRRRLKKEEATHRAEAEIMDQTSTKNKQGWVRFGSPLSVVETNLHFGIRDFTRLKIRQLKGRRKYCVMELGCGPGDSLAELKTEFGVNVRTIGLVLKKTSGIKYNGVDKLLEEDIHRLKLKESPDFIYTHFGSLDKTALKRDALEKVIHWLRPGGTAVLHFGETTPEAMKEIKSTLVMYGITWHMPRFSDVIIFTKH